MKSVARVKVYVHVGRADKLLENMCHSSNTGSVLKSNLCVTISHFLSLKNCVADVWFFTHMTSLTPDSQNPVSLKMPHFPALELGANHAFSTD